MWSERCRKLDLHEQHVLQCGMQGYQFVKVGAIPADLWQVNDARP